MRKHLTNEIGIAAASSVITVISYKDTIFATPFYETISMTVLICVIGIKTSMHYPWDYNDRMTYLRFIGYIGKVSL